MGKPHPAKKSRIAVALLSIFSFVYTVSAMSANGVITHDSPTPSPTEASPTPTVSPATPNSKKLTKKKVKVHTTTGASKKK